MLDFDLGLALTIALGGLGVVFLILILLAVSIVGTKHLAQRIEKSSESLEKKG